MPVAPPLQQFGRINVAAVKSQLSANLGPERSEKYFDFLSKFLSRRLSNQEFTKQCCLILGRDNICLHNQLIVSILKNAFQAKTPPPKLGLRPSASEKILGSNSEHPGARAPEGDTAANFSNGPLVLSMARSNGDILPPSPRKARSSIRDRKTRDQLSPARPTGLAEGPTCQAVALANEPTTANGAATPLDLKRHARYRPGEQPQSLEKRQRIDDSLRDGPSCANRSEKDFWPVPVVNMCARKSQPALSPATSCYSNNELLETANLQSRMEKVVVAEALEGVTTDCAELLNRSLDAYLCRIVQLSVDLVRARSSNSSAVTVNSHMSKKVAGASYVNGVHPVGGSGAPYMQSRLSLLDGTNQLKSPYRISWDDFRASMELDPRQLGANWQTLLEKISNRSQEE